MIFDMNSDRARSLDYYYTKILFRLSLFSIVFLANTKTVTFMSAYP